MPQKKHLVCYADQAYYESQKELCDSALKHGFDEVHPFGREDISNYFLQSAKGILNQSRGAGYWLWKPYLIRKVLESVAFGDIVIYADSGSTIISSMQPVFDLLNQSKDGMWLVQVHGHKNGRWTKGDCFEAIGKLEGKNASEFIEKARNSYQVNGAFQGYVNAPYSPGCAFLTQVLHYCSKPELITDSPSIYSNFPEFEDHRHDQSILSLCALLGNYEIYRDPSQFGLGNDEIKGYPNSPYGQLFNHHRRK